VILKPAMLWPPNNTLVIGFGASGVWRYSAVATLEFPPTPAAVPLSHDLQPTDARPVATLDPGLVPSDRPA